MTPATRHLLVLAAVLALAGVPTVRHSYLGAVAADARRIDSIPLELNGLRGRPTQRSGAWVRQTYGTDDFIERQYGGSLTLFVARSDDAKSLYHHPENGVAHGDGYERVRVVRRPDRPDVPMFVLESASDRYSVYALLHGNDFIEHPIRFQLRQALSLLASPRELTTLFFVRGKGDTTSSGTKAAEALLFSAIDHFRAQSPASAP